jgi:signal transduction histidine kinase
VQRLRPARRALGLRGQIVGAVLVTTVATLAVAALALLGPLEHSLRNAALKTLLSETKGAASSFRNLDLRYVLDAEAPKNDPKHAEGMIEQRRLRAQQQDLGQRIGATVSLIGSFGSEGRGRVLAPPPDVDGAYTDPYDDVARAFRTHRTVPSFASINGTELARAAIPIRIQDGAVRYVLAVRKPIDEIPSAVHAVRTAFVYAALAGLCLTLILAIPLSGKLVGRLRRLRHAALQLAQGAPAVAVPQDRARDEVGDLSRTFALMQRQLQQQEEARRAFVATASHELRTPLTSLDGMLELLDEDLGSGDPDLEDARSLLTRARAQSRRLGRLASDLLDLSRIDAQVQLRSEPVELGELSRAVLAEFELGTSERGVRTTLHDAPRSVWALGDPGSVAQILRILLDNAVKLSPSGGEVTVEMRGGTSAGLSVSDQGPGIPSDERELIFQRFQRGRTASGQAGFGLGLAIGRELAQRMGGELVLEDRDAPGATFTLRLPVASAPETDRVAVV